MLGITGEQAAALKARRRLLAEQERRAKAATKRAITRAGQGWRRFTRQ